MSTAIRAASDAVAAGPPTKRPAGTERMTTWIPLRAAKGAPEKKRRSINRAFFRGVNPHA